MTTAESERRWIDPWPRAGREVELSCDHMFTTWGSVPEVKSWVWCRTCDQPAFVRRIP